MGKGRDREKRKRQQQKRIAKIIRDGKVTAKEASKAQKQGISLNRIQKAQTKSFKSGNAFSKVRAPKKSPFSGGVTSRGAMAQGRVTSQQMKARAKPTYTPLTIQGKAQKVFDQGRAAPAPAPAASPKSGPKPEVNPYQAQFDAYDEMLANLQDQLAASADFAAQFEQMAADQQAQYQAQLQEMQAAQSLAMDEMTARFEEQERQRLLASQTQQANMARSSLTPDLSIGARQSDLYGTSGFKRRRRIRPATIAQGIAPTTPATTPAAGTTNGNLLNV
jgi:hypothetical protein